MRSFGVRYSTKPSNLHHDGARELTESKGAALFIGFPEEGMHFLTELGHREKQWFDENRSTYQRTVVAPSKAFVEELGRQLNDRFDGLIEAQPKTNGSISPINNDRRFNPDAPAYKDHLLFRFWQGESKKSAPTLFIRLSPDDGVGFASGVNLVDIDAWRSAIDRSGGELAAALEHLKDMLGAEVVGEGLKKVPKPYPQDHPYGDLLRHKGFQVRWITETPDIVSTPEFADWCADQLLEVSDVHKWLVDHLS